MSNSYFKERKLTHEYVEMQLYLSITTVGKHRNEKTNSFPGNLLSLHTQSQLNEMPWEGVCKGRNGNALNSEDQVPGTQEKSFQMLLHPSQSYQVIN